MGEQEPLRHELSNKAQNRIAEWKKKLLDLTMRNHMLSFRPRKASTVNLVDLSSYESFLDSFIERDDSITIKNPDNIRIPLDIEDELEYLRPFKNIYKSIKNIEKKVKTANDEYGYNVGYIAYGFLEWTDTDDSDVTYKSPLILIPIEILQEDRFSDVFICYNHNEEIIFNPTICEKLHNDYGIDFDTLEKLNINTAEDIEKSIKEFEAKIREKRNWRICEEFYIDTFDFQNMVILNDLKINESLIEKNKFSALLANGETSGDEYEKEINLSKIKSKEKLQILDADSSQEEAIYRARNGESFVIQGPPGTGKSQTITNIIAEALYAKKSVLFVSEKQAALEVVYDKLKRAKLNVFCLKMHSFKQAKSDIREQLNASISLAMKKMSVPESEFEIYDRIDNAVMKLDSYSNLIHKSIDKVGKTPYWLFGEFEKVRLAPEIHSGVPFEAYDDFKEFMFSVEEYLSVFPAETGYFRNSAWSGYTGEPKDLSKFKSDSDNIHSKYLQLSELVDDILPRMNIGEKDICTIIRDLARQKKLFNEEGCENCNSEWIDVANGSIEIDSRLKSVGIAENSYNAELIKYKRLCEKRDGMFEFLTSRFVPKITKLPEHEALLEKFKNEYNSLFRFINSNYRSDLKNLRKYSKNQESRIGHKDAVECLSAVRDYNRLLRKIKEKSAELDKLFEKVRANLEGFDDAPSMIRAEIDRHKAISIRTDEFDIEPLCSFRATEKYSKKLYEKLQSIAEIDDGNLRDIFDNKQESELFAEVDQAVYLMATIREASKELKYRFVSSDLNIMEQWAMFYEDIAWSEIDDFERYLLKRNMLIEKYEVDGLLDEIEQMNLVKQEAIKAIKKQYFGKCLEIAELRDQYNNSYVRNQHDGVVAEFKTYDEEQRKLAEKRIYCELVNNIPDFSGFSGSRASTSEIALLKREVAKKSRLMPTRKLIASLPILLPKLKPCIMMSPITVSSYFSSNPDKEFDLVIFDEASQVRPEYAITSVMRAKQVIIAGDSKQMPPTSFFSAQVEDDEYDNEDSDDIGSLESVLDEFSVSLPEVSLRWHYRSKDESLIEFSNKKFYQKKLYTFPSVYRNNENLGLNYVFVPDGEWESKYGNSKEAEKVAELVLEHIKSMPDKSLGIVAFGKVQASIIEDVILDMRNEHPEIEEFFNEDKDEPFFVKNLENVQGDERDCIILSVGYGKDPSGKFIMNFGPLTKSGGERRLNVAISRAKEKMTVVSSFKSSEIKDDSNNINRKLLKDFLYFAEHGEEEEIVSGDEYDDDAIYFDSDFEVAVYNFAKSLGYSLKTQVGSSGYRIDMAVVDPNDSSKYILAIECDGAPYHSSKTARDRDRLRQSVLESKGWNFYRIWSMDWYHNNDAEKEKLKRAIEAAAQGKKLSTIKAGKDIAIGKNIVTQGKNDEAETLLRRLRYSFYGDNLTSLSVWMEAFTIVIEKASIDGMSREDLSRYVIKHLLGSNTLTSTRKRLCENCIDKCINKGMIRDVSGSIERIR